MPPVRYGGTVTMAAECQTLHETMATHSPRSAATGAGAWRAVVSPWPSRPPSPAPHVKTTESVESRQQWVAPHDSCRTLEVAQRGEFQE